MKVQVKSEKELLKWFNDNGWVIDTTGDWYYKDGFPLCFLKPMFEYVDCEMVVSEAPPKHLYSFPVYTVDINDDEHPKQWPQLKRWVWLKEWLIFNTSDSLLKEDFEFRENDVVYHKLFKGEFVLKSKFGSDCLNVVQKSTNTIFTDVYKNGKENSTHDYAIITLVLRPKKKSKKTFWFTTFNHDGCDKGFSSTTWLLSKEEVSDAIAKEKWSNITNIQYHSFERECEE